MSVDHPLSAGWRDFPRYPDPSVEVLERYPEPAHIEVGGGDRPDQRLPQA